jgi:putative sterol carrier protein
MSVKPIFEELIAKFDDKVAKDPALKKELEGTCKKVNIDLCSESYSFILSDGKVSCFKEELMPEADITVTSDPQTIKDLHCGKTKIMKCWALKKIRVKGSIEDVMKLRKFF